jgi:eukaryotic-like serine/threonine-protein kinase
VLDTELTDGSDKIARALFVALVTAAHERAMRPESELIAMVGDAERVAVVLEVLRSRGLLVRVRGDGDEPSWELAHDSLVPRVLAWIDARDLDRRRAIELVRYHLRRSRAEAPSLLDRAELRELRPHVAAIAELDVEWQRRQTGEPWTPSRLVERSRRVLRRQTALLASLVGVAAALAGLSLYSNHVAAVARANEAALKAKNLGRFTLSLAPFDWDPRTQRAIAVDAAPLGLDWQLLTSSDDEPGPPFVENDDLERGPSRYAGGARIDDVEARGGRAFLAITRRGCAPSLVPLKELPGYADRERARPVFEIRVPTCAATRAGTAEVLAGPFRYGGAGVPPSRDVAKYPELVAERRITLPRFWIDRTEVTNAAFAMFAGMAARTGIAAPIYPRTPELVHAGGPRKPVTGINWFTARAYCRYLGKDLPTSEQWVKAMRGGEQLADGSNNPIPDRNFPFGDGDPLALAAIGPLPGMPDVATHPGDVSPYGVLDMTGNAEEWTLSPTDDPGVRVLRGGGIEDYVRDNILAFMALPNSRVASQPMFSIGARCVIND